MWPGNLFRNGPYAPWRQNGEAHTRVWSSTTDSAPPSTQSP
jgi:hypothetical protein